MVYRKIVYTGNTLVGLEKRIKEIAERKEEIIFFSIECFEGEERND